MGKYNKDRFKSIIIYADDYHRLEKMRKTSKESMAELVHLLLEVEEATRIDDTFPVSKKSSIKPSSIIEPKGMKAAIIGADKPSIIETKPSIIGVKPTVDTEEIPKEIRDWYERWRKQGTGAFRFTSSCEAMGHTEKQCEKWLEMLKAE